MPVEGERLFWYFQATISEVISVYKMLAIPADINWTCVGRSCVLYVGCVCALCMCVVYVRCVCALCMCVVYVRCVCALCMSVVYVRCVSALCMCDVYVRCACAWCMCVVYVHSTFFGTIWKCSSKLCVNMFTDRNAIVKRWDILFEPNELQEDQMMAATSSHIGIMQSLSHAMFAMCANSFWKVSRTEFIQTHQTLNYPIVLWYFTVYIWKTVCSQTFQLLNFEYQFSTTVHTNCS